MDITVHHIRRSFRAEVHCRLADIGFAVHRSDGVSIVAPETNPSIIIPPGGQSYQTVTVALGGSGSSDDLYGAPYFTDSDTDYFYYSWARLSGPGWLARRVSSAAPDSQTEIEFTSGDQPQTLVQFQEAFS